MLWIAGRQYSSVYIHDIGYSRLNCTLGEGNLWNRLVFFDPQGLGSARSAD